MTREQEEKRVLPAAIADEQLIQRIRKLADEIDHLAFVRDDLIFRVCPALRAIYEEQLGRADFEK